ncbi:hypothetical protein [Lutibacter sp. B1]|uniref:hypothetical protein n=1 Tax=Lutibacter sp. B1 TaxID=2725996 RepID=UPI0014565CD4|nr:hypothetical protein [Lutibacter sp. B1]NLP58014.1 hypothetical protein [Lutibacter sp. B1]
MKKIAIFLVATVLFSSVIYSQGRNQRFRNSDNYTPEQIAELQTKRLVLQLDLTDKQQKEIYNLKIKQAEERDKFVKEYREKRQNGTLTSDERFAYSNTRLERQLEVKKAMKNILTKEQFEKWELICQPNNDNLRRNFRNYNNPNCPYGNRTYKNKL